MESLWYDNVIPMSPIDLDSFMFNPEGITRFLPKIGTLSQDMQVVAISIFETGKANKWHLIKHLVEKKKFKRSRAKRLIEIALNLI